MKLLHWSLLGGLGVSLAVACGSSDSSKAEKELTGGAGGEAGSAPSDPAGGKPVAGSSGAGGSTPALAGMGGVAPSGDGGVAPSSDGGVAGALDAPNAGEGGALAQAGAGGAETQGGAGGAFSCVPAKLIGGHVYYSTLPSVADGEVRIASAMGDVKLTDGQNPKLSPNGKLLAFQKGRRSLTDMSTADLWIRDMDAATQKSIFTNADHQVGYSFTNTSDKLLFDSVCGQYSINPDGTGGSTLFNVDCYDDAPSVQPNATAALAYHNQSGIQLRDAAFANQKQLTNSVAGDYWPSWSADGNWLNFCRYTDATKNCAYYKIAPNGDGLVHLGDTIKGQNAAFSSDGTKIVVGGLVDGAGGLHVFAADGSGYLGTVCEVGSAQVEFVGTITAN